MTRPHELATAQLEFSRRALTYSRLDERFAPHTRFFAAAALTNTVLAQLCAHRARWIYLSQTTVAALMTLGGMLETINLRRADRIEGEAMAARRLDASFIEMEQTFVESVLRSWARTCTPYYDQLIAELDRLLRAVATGFMPLPISADVRRYARVLRTVARTSGRCPSFAVRDDRINIGTALILEARQLADGARLQPSMTSIWLLGSAASSSQSSSSSRMWNTSSSIAPAPRKP